jgi:phage terminase small subunit
MLNPKQQRFVKEYVIDLNGTQAAIRAGYSPKTANSISSQLLTKLNIQEAIAVAQKKVTDNLDITAERVLREIAQLGFANMDDYTTEDEEHGLRLDLSKTTRAQRAAISEFTEDTTGGSGDGERKAVLRTKIKLWDKPRGLEMLGKHLKLFTDIVRHEGLESLVGVLGEKEQ